MSTYSDASLILPVAPERKAGKIYCLKPTDGTGDFTVARTGDTATEINSDLEVKDVVANMPRFNFESLGGCPTLLTEPQSENLITYSENFSLGWLVFGAGGGTVTRTANYGTSPTGDVDSTRVQFTDTNTALYFNLTLAGDSNGTIYVKGIAGEVIGFGLGTSVSGGVDFTFNGEWQRLEHQFSNVGASSLTLNTWSVSRTARDFEIFGAQAESDSLATSYIPTSGATVIRVADNITDAGDVNTFNSPEGTLFIDTKALVDGGYLMTTSIYKDANNYVAILFRNVASEVWAQIKVGGTTTNIFMYDVPQNVNNKMALAWDTNYIRFYVNGVLKGTSSSFISFGANVLTTLDLNNVGGTEPFYGNTKDIRAYPVAKTDVELTALTS